MADHNIGKIFVELDLDASRYLKGQQQLLKDATTTSLNIEQNFKNLGIKSSAVTVTRGSSLRRLISCNRIFLR